MVEIEREEANKGSGEVFRCTFRVSERESIEVVPFLRVAMFICHMGPSLALVQPLPSISILSPSTVHHSPFYPLSFPIFISHRNSTAAKLRSFIPPPSLLIVLPNSHKLPPLPSPKPSTKKSPARDHLPPPHIHLLHNTHIMSERPQNVGIKAIELYVPSQVSSQRPNISPSSAMGG